MVPRISGAEPRAAVHQPCATCRTPRSDIFTLRCSDDDCPSFRRCAVAAARRWRARRARLRCSASCCAACATRFSAARCRPARGCPARARWPRRSACRATRRPPSTSSSSPKASCSPTAAVRAWSAVTAGRAGVPPRAVAQRLGRIRPSRIGTGESEGFRPGVPALTHFPADAWRHAIDRALRRAGRDLLGYGDPLGGRAARIDRAPPGRDARRALRSRADRDHGRRTGRDRAVRAVADEPGRYGVGRGPGYARARTAMQAADLDVVRCRSTRKGCAPRTTGASGRRASSIRRRRTSSRPAPCCRSRAGSR